MNKFEEALKEVVGTLDNSNTEGRFLTRSNLDLMQELVKRATPMKPILRNLSVEYDCPNCAKYVGWVYEKSLFCPRCGQAIYWGDKV